MMRVKVEVGFFDAVGKYAMSGWRSGYRTGGARRRIFCVAFFVLCAFCHKAGAESVKSVFVIAMENHNWTQPATDTSAPHQIFNNPDAPFINSIVNSGFNGGVLSPEVTLYGASTPISINSEVSYATAYHNVLATASGNNPHIHPSEPSYIWSEAGTNFGVANDNSPYGSNGNNQTTNAHLTAYLHRDGHTWKSYQEDIDTDAAGYVLPQSQWYSPINNRSGNYTTVPNAYNGSLRYDYAVKHNPPSFFTDTNGGNNTTFSNPAAVHYAPLQQLQIDLNNNSTADYNWISPNQSNDMHTALTGGYKGLTGGRAAIKQGDDFLAKVVPMIMSSQAYQNDGAIIIWNDETEGSNADDFSHTIMEIVISPLAKGYGYASSLNYTHSSDLKTMQEIFQVGPLLGDAGTSTTLDLADMFLPNTIPTTVPVAGDFDHNGSVDAADYVLWRQKLASNYSPTDYGLWRSHFGQSAMTVAAAFAIIPEPPVPSLSLIAAALGMNCATRNRQWMW
jgi:phosphatidylinositol-3-phosphatase